MRPVELDDANQGGAIKCVVKGTGGFRFGQIESFFNEGQLDSDERPCSYRL
jgi:hypothetical protein